MAEEKRFERKVQLQREVDLKEVHPEGVQAISDPNRSVKVVEHYRHPPARKLPEVSQDGSSP